MSQFKVRGGNQLSGTIIPQGAKNEALQILCAVLLSKEPIVIHNIPAIRDVNKLMELLEDMGVRRSKVGEGSYKFEADSVNYDYFETDDYNSRIYAYENDVLYYFSIPVFS